MTHLIEEIVVDEVKSMRRTVAASSTRSIATTSGEDAGVSGQISAASVSDGAVNTVNTSTSSIIDKHAN